MAVFVFPCTGGEGSTTLGFLSRPLRLTQGRGQAQTHAELHIYMEGSLNNKTFGLCLPPTHVPCPSCQWSGRCGALDMPGALPQAVLS